MLRSPIRLRYDDEDDDTSHCDVERMPCDHLSPDTRPQDTRSPFVAHSRNGRTKYRSSEKMRDDVSPIAANETCIWSPAYFSGRKKRCCGARIMRTTCVLDKKLTYRFRIHDETVATNAARYSTLRDNFQRQTRRNILPEERARNRNEESSFVESYVWITLYKCHKRNHEVFVSNQEKSSNINKLLLIYYNMERYNLQWRFREVNRIPYARA